jgi:anti-anti-sigma factor
MESATQVVGESSSRTQRRAGGAFEERPLAIRSERDGPSHLIEVFGELDIATAPRLDEELRRIEALDQKQVLLDLRGLDFIDSEGVRVLLAATRRFRSGSTRLRMFRGGPEIERILRILGLDKDLPFLD